MYTKFRGKIYSVGDGFCYEGIIKNECSRNNFHFVIDCGNKVPTCRKKWKEKLSKNDCEKRLDEITDEIALNGKHLNLFILTHFHNDHYSGYVRLFRKTKIDIIIMPYLYPEERLCLFINGNSNDARFLINPYTEFLNIAIQNNPDVKLILIRGNDINENKDSVFDSENVIWGSEHEENENILEIEDLDVSHAQVVRALSNGSQIREFTWKFKFFNIELDDSKLTQLRNFVGVLNPQKLANLIKVSHTQLKREYELIANDLHNDINNTSIVIYHSSIESIKIYGKCGTLITGDISLKFGIADKIIDFFKEEMDKIGLFSIPHHGSEYNWDDKFIINSSMNNIVCFASTHNYYSNRLTCKMVSALRCHNISVLVVDENRFSEIYQHINNQPNQIVYKFINGKKHVQIIIA